MAFPPAPWFNRGYAIFSLHLIDTARARAFIPQDLGIIEVRPGKTVGVFFGAHYGPGSALEYNELIVAPALTRLGGRFGFFISHIYVDNEDSMASGREIWGLPKEMAQFTWSDGRFSVYQASRPLADLQWKPMRTVLPVPFLLPTLSILGSSLLAFHASVSARLGLMRGTLNIPDESPFAALGMHGSKWVFRLDNMTFRASKPGVVGAIHVQDSVLGR